MKIQSYKKKFYIILKLLSCIITYLSIKINSSFVLFSSLMIFFYWDFFFFNIVCTSKQNLIDILSKFPNLLQA